MLLSLTLPTGHRGRRKPANSPAQSRSSYETRPECLSYLVIRTRVFPHSPGNGARCAPVDLGVIWKNHILGLDAME